MATWRFASVLLVALWAVPASGEGRSATFGVSVRVVAPLRTRAQQQLPPASFVPSVREAALPCGAPSSAGCQAAIAAAAARAPGQPVIVTLFTDGQPSAVVER
ncbi:MAG: hypothetical protein RJA59_2125 [Pseudomonadota bacterium]|jgi:hypothetical protein